MRKTKKSGETLLEKYYRQKEWTVFEYICIIVGVIFVALGIFAPRGLSYSLPVLLVTIAALAISKSSKIDPSVVDDRLEELLRANGIVEEKNVSLSTYDLQAERVIRGSDGILRSNRYIVCKCIEKKTGLCITVWRIDLIAGSADMERYDLQKDENIELTEDEIATTKGKKKIYFLENEHFHSKIPVCVDDVEESELIQKICHSEESR